MKRFHQGRRGEHISEDRGEASPVLHNPVRAHQHAGGPHSDTPAGLHDVSDALIERPRDTLLHLVSNRKTFIDGCELGAE